MAFKTLTFLVITFLGIGGIAMILDIELWKALAVAIAISIAHIIEACADKTKN